jgi:hypothetical protein
LRKPHEQKVWLLLVALCCCLIPQVGPGQLPTAGTRSPVTLGAPLEPEKATLQVLDFAPPEPPIPATIVFDALKEPTPQALVFKPIDPSWSKSMNVPGLPLPITTAPKKQMLPPARAEAPPPPLRLEVLPPETEPMPPLVVEVLPPEPKPMPPLVVEVLPPEPKPMPPLVVEALPPESEPMLPLVVEVLPPEPKPMPPLIVNVLPPESKPMPRLIVEVPPPESEPMPPLIVNALPPESKPMRMPKAVSDDHPLPKPFERPSFGSVVGIDIDARSAILPPAVSTPSERPAPTLVYSTNNPIQVTPVEAVRPEVRQEATMPPVSSIPIIDVQFEPAPTERKYISISELQAINRARMDAQVRRYMNRLGSPDGTLRLTQSYPQPMPMYYAPPPQRRIVGVMHWAFSSGSSVCDSFLWPLRMLAEPFREFD